MTGWPEGVGRRVLEEVDSTNAEAARIAGSLRGPEWILALRQSAARGRRGRAWANPEGNFAATLAMRPTESPDKVALRSFVASLALFDAFVSATGRAEGFTLKWPNDVLLNGGKLAGILLESAGSGGGMSYFAIGIGVNLVSAPDQAQVEAGALRPVSLLSETGVRVTPEELLDLLAPAYAHYEAQFTTYGFAPIRAAWLERAAKLGEVITARTTRNEITGTFETVDEAGNLVLTTAKSRHAIPAAEVFF
ncbi:BirA family biotin operon repressor/biotin-[acetyl-CoA-carboxylase] ligase [Roseovarius halotolerans]|uniref:biotin--[biotin carboxyl-carrier protein] ligase n=1 Tax=Roseovarius halotolerans TaxID=505353 RepID=A0A1X6Z952_9RHOB|nr:biotin--[acetyl-CoA-carboxylase] ligase [Roseovarius halotolerans]RKT30401.1 BirA family biotin operon repressor/biotin-[acetyl-CoA-carboxylase] ligase [Roseovarius halotolerans]SLN43958.1 Bifunctional ligase/repressor BirA [Roseovarius halotolerans]